MGEKSYGEKDGKMPNFPKQLSFLSGILDILLWWHYFSQFLDGFQGTSVLVLARRTAMAIMFRTNFNFETAILIVGYFWP